MTFWAYELLIQALAEGRNLAFFLALKKQRFFQIFVLLMKTLFRVQYIC